MSNFNARHNPAPAQSTVNSVISGIETALIGGMVSTAIILVSTVTGCTDYVLNQVEKDVATSTIYPRSYGNERQGEFEISLVDFRAQATHANKALAQMKITAMEDME